MKRPPTALRPRRPAARITAASFAGERFPVESTVTFRNRAGDAITGTVTELRQDYAIVAAGDNGRYRVPYSFLTLLVPGPRGGVTLAEIEHRAHALIGTHELTSGLAPAWRFTFQTTPNRAGVCLYRTKTIGMSLSYAIRASWHELNDTLLHEIAHAIVGPRHHHDAVWKAKARQIGCSAQRCTTVRHTVGRWLGHCPTCRRTFTRHRLTAKMRTRAVCTTCRTRITWSINTHALTR